MNNTVASGRRWRTLLPYLTRIVFVGVVLCGVFAPAFGEDRSVQQRDAAFKQNKRLGRGVNILGYDPIWTSPAEARFHEDYFKLIRDAGFDHVRINLHAFQGAQADGTLSNRYLKTLDWAIQQSLANKLAVILDFHEFLAVAKDPKATKPRFLNVWKQLAERYKDYPNDVFFEILNEPNGQLTPALWNRWLREALAIIRQTNPDRTVIVGPGHWNSIGLLEELDLPKDDPNLIVTVHYYDPFAFTHQGAPWMEFKDKTGVVWRGNEEERRAISRDFDRVQTWAKKHHRPIYLGEFGAYDKADMPSRVRYLDAVAREAEERGWSWGYWQFDSNFILFDVANRRWIEPLLEALIPRR